MMPVDVGLALFLGAVLATAYVAEALLEVESCAGCRKCEAWR